jgi:hypothetical protein
MAMNFPFGEISGTYEIYRNQQLDNEFRLDCEVTFMEDGKTAEKLEWSVDGGILRLRDGDGTVAYEFIGVEMVNGIVAASGFYRYQGVPERVVMCKRLLLSEVKWRICVSSHPKNEKDVMPKLIKSMKQAGVDLSAVTVVVGSVPYAEAFSRKSSDGISYVSTDINLKGLTSLSKVCNEGVEYHFMMHDTCTVAEDFMARMGAISLGLHPDIVLFRPPSEGLDMGVYSESFLEEQDDLVSIQDRDRFDTLWRRAEVAVIMPGIKVVRSPQDHYHNKVLRAEWKMSRVGVSKLKRIGR